MAISLKTRIPEQTASGVSEDEKRSSHVALEISGTG